MHTDTEKNTPWYISVCECVRVHKQESIVYTLKQTLLKEFQGSFRICLCEIAHIWTRDWFHVPIWLFSVPLSVMMPSKRVATLEQDLTGFTAKQSPWCWRNGGKDNDNDDGGYRGVIIVHGGFCSVWMSKTERLEEWDRGRNTDGNGVWGSCIS